MKKKRIEEILKGKYAEVRVVVERIDDYKKPSMPVCNLKLIGSNTMTNYALIKTLEEIIKHIKKEDNMIDFADAILNTKVEEVRTIRKELEIDE